MVGFFRIGEGKLETQTTSRHTRSQKVANPLRNVCETVAKGLQKALLQKGCKMPEIPSSEGHRYVSVTVESKHHCRRVFFCEDREDKFGDADYL